jgi:enterobactin synthetase component D / holo-[acyl-carrier protein] synthase
VAAPNPTDPRAGSPFGVLAGLLPPGVAVVEADPEAEPPELHPDEADLVAKAVEKRRREFAWGRHCARGALRAHGSNRADAAIGRGERGEPRWPDGVVGSITHCAGYSAAVVASPSTTTAIGIDAEPVGLLPRRVWEMISTPHDREALVAAVGRRPGTYEIVLFSAKESTYKAWYPTTGEWLGFQDAEVSIDPVAGTFQVSLLVTAPEPVAPVWRSAQGRFAITPSHVLSTLWLPPARNVV